MAPYEKPSIAAFAASQGTFCSTSLPTIWSAFRNSSRLDAIASGTIRDDPRNRVPTPQRRASHSTRPTEAQQRIQRFFSGLLGPSPRSSACFVPGRSWAEPTQFSIYDKDYHIYAGGRLQDPSVPESRARNCLHELTRISMRHLPRRLGSGRLVSGSALCGNVRRSRQTRRPLP